MLEPRHFALPSFGNLDQGLVICDRMTLGLTLRAAFSSRIYGLVWDSFAAALRPGEDSRLALEQELRENCRA